MCFPNLIGVFILLPVIRTELLKFIDFTRRVDGGKSIKQAADEVTREYP
jgi:hypothetical protein